MFKYLLLSLFLVIPVLAQTDSEDQIRAYLEEHGSPVINNTEYSELFRDSTSTWNALLSAPSGFGRAIMETIGDYVYVFTGQNTTSLAIAYHIPTNTWVNSTPPTASYNSGYCAADGKIYKCSGSTNGTVFERFTPTGDGTGTWTQLTPGPTAVMNAQNSLVYDGSGAIYVQSGSYTSPYPSYLYKYEIAADTWTAKTGALHNRRYAGMAHIGKEIFMIGGLVGDGTTGNICQKYSTAEDSWSLIAPLPEVVSFTKWSVTTDGNYVFLLGSGGGYSSYPASPNAWYYHPGMDIWAQETALPAPRGLVHGIYLPSVNKLLWGGGNNTVSSTAYQPHIWEGVGGVYVPVEFVSFTAGYTPEGVELRWRTATETNNSYFAVERSSDNSIFTQITMIPGAGTTLEQKEYAFIDKDVNAGNYYYRLKQVDYDGSFSYSNIVNVNSELPSSFKLEQNYPNPFNPATTISYQLPENGFVSLQVYDPVGNCVASLVNEEQSAGTHFVRFDASSLSSGVYYYKITSGNFSSVKKLMLLK
jgi:hypothetical protein